MYFQHAAHDFRRLYPPACEPSDRPNLQFLCMQVDEQGEQETHVNADRAAESDRRMLEGACPACNTRCAAAHQQCSAWPCVGPLLGLRVLGLGPMLMSRSLDEAPSFADQTDPDIRGLVLRPPTRGRRFIGPVGVQRRPSAEGNFTSTSTRSSQIEVPVPGMDATSPKW